MVRDISKGSYLLRWHTHRLVTKTCPLYLLIGVFFLISMAYNVNKQRKPLYVAVTALSISGTSKILKNYTEPYCHFDRKVTVHTLSVYQYTFLLCINTAKDIYSCNLNLISNSCERSCPLSLALVLTQISITMPRILLC